MTEKILLKKYANRRLYDTEKSAYVTLNQVAELVQEGRQVEVIDAKSGEDVTAFILTQIILEEAKKRNALLPVPLLHLIIQYGGNVLQEFFDNYLQQTIRNYLIYKKTADEQFGKWLEMGADFSATTQRALSGLTPFHPFLNGFTPSEEKPKKKP